MNKIEANEAFSKRLEKIESTLLRFLPKQSNEKWIFESFGKIDTSVNQSHLKNLLEPTRNLLDLGGKRWRPLLLVLCAESLGGKNGASKGIELTPLVEFAHTASLIHDDIEDSADERRGADAAHILFGLDVALNAASWLYFQSSCCIDASSLSVEKKLALHALYCQELRRLHLGQAMDILWHRNPDLFPSISEYDAMVKNKTGTLARLAVKTGFLAGGSSEEKANEAGKSAEEIGRGFQIIDDVINLTSGNLGKKRGDDIVEGKKSLPVLLHLKKKPEDAKKISELFFEAKKNGIESAAVEKAIKLLSESGSIEEAKREGNLLIEKNGKALASLLCENGENEGANLVYALFESLKK